MKGPCFPIGGTLHPKEEPPKGLRVRQFSTETSLKRYRRAHFWPDRKGISHPLESKMWLPGASRGDDSGANRRPSEGEQPVRTDGGPIRKKDIHTSVTCVTPKMSG